jgi:hypothetical protein
MMIVELLLATAAPATPPKDPPPPPYCDQIESMPNWPAMSDWVYRPGARLPFKMMWRDGPFGEKEVPKRCMTKPKVTGAATLEKDGVVRVKETAQGGEEFSISLKIDGKPQVYTYKVTGADEQVLFGKWHPRSNQSCRGRIPGEIVFGTAGRYSYTFPEQMIETMTSGGGRYRWDQATRELLPGEPTPPPCRIVLG